MIVSLKFYLVLVFMRNADSINDLRLRIKLQGKEAKNKDIMDELGGLKMADDEEKEELHSFKR